MGALMGALTGAARSAHFSNPFFFISAIEPS